MRGRRPRVGAPRRVLPPEPTPGEDAAFDRWLADGLSPDDHDRAAGRLLADAWRDRRRAFDAATSQRTHASERRRRVWWWAPVALVAVAAVALVTWPTPIVVDDAALAGAYLDALGALPSGAP